MSGTRVTMVRTDLEGIPQHHFPPGYSIRWYRPGDRGAWVRIHLLSEKYQPISPALYDEQFERNETELIRRQAFLLDAQGGEVGTATAWFDPAYHGRPFGRVHWVAIVPAHQGGGLAKPLMTAVCNRLVELGHDCAYLSTSTVRLPALQLYLDFGFKPDIAGEEDRGAWAPVLDRLEKLRGSRRA